MARQHTFFGKGAPDIVPTNLNQHYVDLYNRKVYLSRGKQTVDDWGSPLVDENALSKILQDFAVPDTSPVFAVSAVKSGQVVLAKVDPVEHNDHFMVVTNPVKIDETLPESYIVLDLRTSSSLIAGGELIVYNSTPLRMRVTAEGGTQISFTREQDFITPYGLARLKVLNTASTSSKGRWLVTGDVGNSRDLDTESIASEIDSILVAVTRAINAAVSELNNSNSL